jgi:hypothetical protein
MAKKLGDQETVTLEEIVISSSFEIAAMFNIMERKGLITRKELEEELKRLRTVH